MNKKDIAIIGGGAAGMMAAASLLEHAPEVQVHFFEGNAQLGAKVRISGGGRCNVTTGEEDWKRLLDAYSRGRNFLRSALYALPPEAVREFFEGHGVPLKMEQDKRVFPVSDNGADVVGIFEQMFRKADQMKVYMRTKVSTIEQVENGFLVTYPTGSCRVDAVILTTGGQAYRHTGSQGDGYSFAEALGHSITPLAASLHSFHMRESWLPALAGVSVEDVACRVVGEKKLHSRGPVLCTHKGITGPAVFALSSRGAYLEFPFVVELDWLPWCTEEDLRKRLQVLDSKPLLKNQQFKLPGRLWHALLGDLGEKRLQEVSRKDWHQLIQRIKHTPLTAVGRGAGDEFVTAGGVSTTEVDKKTMASRLCSGLYFAGEILDVDGITGGFNLQAAWATGWVAGESAAAYLLDEKG